MATDKQNMKFGIKKIILVVLLFILASGIGSVIFNRLILPQISTLPILRGIKLFDQQAPIIITRREEIRIDGEINTQEVISRVRGALVKVYVFEGKPTAGKTTAVLSGLVATNDGLILIPARLVKRGVEVSVVVESGISYPGVVLFVDPHSGIGFVNITVRDLPVLNETLSRDKKPGESLLSLSLDEGLGITVQPVNFTETSTARPSLTALHDFSFFNTALELTPTLTEDNLGSIIVDKDGALVGFVSLVKDKPAAIRVDDLQLVVDNFLSNKSLGVKWPQFKISYLILGPVQVEFLGLPKQNGIVVRTADKPLAVGDFVYAVDGRDISAENSFQQMIMSKKPGEKANLKLLRNGLEMEVEISL